MKKHILRSLFICFVSILLTFSLHFLGVIEPVERITWDMRVRFLSKPEASTEKIILILVDQESLDWAENELSLPWPWPRQVLKPIIDFVKRGGAKSLAFDVIFSELSAYGKYDDDIFTDSIKDSNIFVGALNLHNKDQNFWEPSIPYPNIDITGIKNWIDKDTRNYQIYNKATFPIENLGKNALFLANVHETPDSDGIFRNGNLFFMYNNKIVPSMALASYLVSLDKPANISIVKNYLKINNKSINIDQQGKSLLRYRGTRNTHRSIPAAAIIRSELQIIEGKQSQIDPQIFKDSHVFFGYSAPGLFDIRATPMSGEMLGVEIHATMLDNLLSEDFMKKSNIVMSLFIIIILSVLTALLVTKFNISIKGIIITTLLLLIPITISLGFYIIGIWFPFVFLELSIVFSISGAGILNYIVEGKQKRYIKHAFKQYLSHDFIENLLKNPDKLKLGGEKKEITIFFSDLEGFTTISEGLTPEALTSLLNRYLTAMTDIILADGGTIDKYEGDAIIAFWNAPLSYHDHAIRAVRAALLCQEKLTELNEDFRKDFGHELKMRIGVNTGYAVVGNLGSNTRFDYTMLGDSVNLAARLEGINKYFGTYTMISESTKAAIKDEFNTREISNIVVKGKSQSIKVYEPILEDNYTKNMSTIKIFEQGLELYYKGLFIEALESFNKIKDLDPAAKSYCNKCDELMNCDTSDWKGIWTMTAK